MAVIFVDYKNGVDTNDGSTGSPLKTLTHCLASHAANGDTIKLRGSNATDEIYRETDIATTKTGLTIENDTGHRPEIWGSMPYSSWSLTAGQAATYEAACLAGACYMVWSGASYDTWFTKKTSIAEVEATENSFWLDAANDKLYAHVTGGGNPGTLEAQALPSKWPSTGLAINGADGTVRGITFCHHMANITTGAANITLDGCTSRDPAHADLGSATGIGPAAANTLIKNCLIRNRHGSGINTGTGASGMTVSGCRIVCDHPAIISTMTGYYGVYVDVGTGHVVEGCIITGWLDGIYVKTGMTCELRYSTLIDCWHGFAIWENNSPVVAHHNICYFTRDLGNTAATHGFILHNYGTSQVHHNVFAYMNRPTGATPHGCGLHVAPGSGGTQVLYASNNAFYNCKIGIDNVSGTIEWHLGNNAFYGNTTDMDAIAGGDQGIGNVLLDPQFVNPGNYDFRLLPTSPCIDAGVAVAGINEGFRSGAPDIGAHEFVRPLRHGRR